MTVSIIIVVGIVVLGYIMTLGARLNHLHRHQVDVDALLEWLVTRQGGDPEEIIKSTHAVHYDSEIGGPNNGY